MTSLQTKDRDQETIISEIIEHLLEDKDLAEDIELVKVMETESVVEDFITQKNVTPDFDIEPELKGFAPIAPFSLISSVEDKEQGTGEKGILALPVLVVDYKLNNVLQQRIKLPSLWFIFNTIELAYEVSDYLTEIIEGGDLIDNYSH